MQGREVVALTSLRGMAAVWVVLFHLQPLLFDALPGSLPLRPLIAAGRFAVPLFFVLSGYVLSLRYAHELSALHTPALLRFWWLRLGRIYPVHLLTLLVSLLLVARRGWPDDDGHTPQQFVANLSLTHAWQRSFSLSWNYPSWSISSEWFAYLLFPWLAAGLFRLGPLALRVGLGASWVLAMAVQTTERTLPYAGLWEVSFLFGGGALLARLYPATVARRPSAAWGTGCLLVGCAVPFLVGDTRLEGAIFISLFFVMIAALGSDDTDTWWHWRPLRYIGDISYSLYMTHAISITLLSRLLPRVAPESPLWLRAGAVIAYLLAIFAGALCASYAVEQPCRSWSRRVLWGRAVSSPHPELAEEPPHAS
jgi:peptidoglycan/LPS O-acetylase OafA/YrhL